MHGIDLRRLVFGNALAIAASALVLFAITAIFLLAPMESTMEEAQRIVYVHVAVAWLGLMGFMITAASGALYLFRRNLAWDEWARAAAELGWVCSSLTLVTGSLWAHAAWDVWWTWDPRLTSSFILWAMYCGYLLLLGGLEDPHRSARLRAVLALLGAADVPLIVLATRWFRGIHPVSPEMEPSMQVILLISVVSFTVFFAFLLGMRRTQLRQENRLAELGRLADKYKESTWKPSSLPI